MAQKTAKSLISTRKSYQNDGFDSILTQIWTKIWLISELIFGLKTGPLRGPVLSENTRNYTVFTLAVGPKGLHFGGTFGSILGSILLPFWPPCFGAGQPAEITILGSLRPGPGPEVRKPSRSGH